MSEELDEIKSKIDIVQFISEFVPLKKTGRNFKANCPFHNEKTPSFVVSPERQIWHCFGCNEGGDIFGFLMKIENIEFPEALRILAKRAGVTLQNIRPSGDADKKEKIYEINHLSSEFYHYLLLNRDFSKPALDYLTKRGITKNTIETFKIGFAPNLWQSVSRFLVGKKRYSFSDLELAGLCLRGRDYYDRFRGRIIFPLIDYRGNVIGFSGRLLSSDVKEAKYINSPETPVYSKSNHLFGIFQAKENIKKNNLAILVEGEFDMISSYQAGVQNVVAIKGSALTEGHVKLLKKYTQNLAFALDSDFAGSAASHRGIELADNEGLNIRVITLPFGKDPDECVKKDPSLWHTAIKNAAPVYDYIINSALKHLDIKSPEGKKQFSEDVLTIISKIGNEIVKFHYIKKIAGILDVDENSVVKEIDKISRQKQFGVKEDGIKEVAQKNNPETTEEYLLSIIFQDSSPFDFFVACRNIVKSQDFQTPALRRIYAFLEKESENNNKWDLKEIISKMPAELNSIIDRLFLVDVSISNEKNIISELEKISRHIVSLSLKARMKDIAQKIKEKEETKEFSDLKELNEEFRLVVSKLKSLQS